MRSLDSYSDRIESAPKKLRALIEKDSRIVAFTVEADGVFIYTRSAEWCDDSGSGTFRGDTVSEAIRRFKDCVMPFSDIPKVSKLGVQS
jgi:hypothetical protein